MDSTTTFLSHLPTILSIASTIIIGLIGWGYHATVAAFRSETKTLKEIETKQEERLEKLEDALNNLKSDLPLVYVLREDFVRTMNNVETKIMGVDNKIDRILDKLAQGGKLDG
jgi:hypothetical protein